VGKNNFPAKPTFTHFPRRVSRCRFRGKNNSPAKLTSTCFPRRVSRCRFGGMYGNCFLLLTLVSAEE
jgi:hypothetical protein